MSRAELAAGGAAAVAEAADGQGARLVLSVGMGVQSSMRPIFRPERESARSADWAPGPGVFVLLPPVARSLMCSAVTPSSCGRGGRGGGA